MICWEKWHYSLLGIIVACAMFTWACMCAEFWCLLYVDGLFFSICHSLYMRLIRSSRATYQGHNTSLRMMCCESWCWISKMCPNCGSVDVFKLTPCIASSIIVTQSHVSATRDLALGSIRISTAGRRPPVTHLTLLLFYNVHIISVDFILFDTVWISQHFILLLL